MTDLNVEPITTNNLPNTSLTNANKPAQSKYEPSKPIPYEVQNAVKQFVEQRLAKPLQTQLNDQIAICIQQIKTDKDTRNANYQAQKDAYRTLGTNRFLQNNLEKETIPRK
jgi:hypothetical protein